MSAQTWRSVLVLRARLLEALWRRQVSRSDTGAGLPRVNGFARVLLSAAILMLGAACSPDGESVPAPQRIILFSMDTVRADHVSGYGPLDTTPTLEDVAGAGVLFRDVYAASSYTIPSHMSIFTGLDPAEHGVHRMHARLHPARCGDRSGQGGDHSSHLLHS